MSKAINRTATVSMSFLTNTTSSIPSEQKSASTKTTQRPFFNLTWILSEMILWSFFILLMSIVVGLINFFYGLTKESRGKLKKKRQIVLYVLCIISLILALLRNVTNQIVAFLGWKYSAICDVFVRSSYALYFLCMMTVFLFLWFRQIVFYANPLLSFFLNPFMVAGSWLSIVLVLGGGSGLILLFVHPAYNGWEFAATQSGCRDISLLPNNFVPKLLIYFTVFVHIILLIFFLYPLLSKNTKPYSGDLEPEISLDESIDVSSADFSDAPRRYGKAEQEAQRQLRLEQGERIITFIYKMCIVTLLCVGVDVAITSGQFLIVGEPELIYLTLFDINIFVNIICIISSFNEWLHMMFPTCCSRKSKRRLRKEENQYETPPRPKKGKKPEKSKLKVPKDKKDKKTKKSRSSANKYKYSNQTGSYRPGVTDPSKLESDSEYSTNQETKRP